MGQINKQQYSSAFALPVVLITSVVMMMVLLSGLTAATSVSAGLKNQYLNQLSRTASQSGTAMAKACMEGNNGAITWTDEMPLRPNTNCSGVESIACTNTSADAACYVLKSNNFRSTFKVGITSDGSGNPTDIAVQGIVREVRKTSGQVLYENRASQKAKLQNPMRIGGGDTMSVFNAGACSIAEGTLYCWGYNGYGQLGIGGSSYGTTPTAVAGVLAGKTVTKVSSSFDVDPGNLYGHTCAIADGSLYCWGYNGYYQLGNGNTSTQTTPVLIAGGLAGKTVTDVVTYNSGTCAIASGGLYCWGYNNYGQAGNGTSTSYITTPTAVVNPLAGKTVSKVAVANTTNPYFHVCAIAEGSLYCWGYNTNYQVGNGNTTTQYSPVLIAGGLSGKTVTDVVTHSLGGCAVANSNLYCWGYSGTGQAGTGSTGSVTTPTAAAGPLSGKVVTKVSASADSNPGNGYAHVCAISEGNLYCWGYNGNYQVGNGNTTNQNTPVLLAGGLSGKTVTDVTTYDLGTCAVANGSAYCWGYGSYGQIGNGSTSSGTTPTAVASPLAGKTVTRIMGSGDAGFGSGYGHVCAATSDNNMYCWGYNNYYQVDSSGSTRSSPVSVGVRGLPSGIVKSVASGGSSTCAIGSDSKVYCWGDNSSGKLGDNSTTQRLIPVPVAQGNIPSGVTAKSTSLSSNHACMIGSDNKAYCWGNGSTGMLGNNTLSPSYVPSAVSQGSVPVGVTFKSVATGSQDHTCAHGSDDKAYCWGYGTFGQLGDNVDYTWTSYSAVPVVVSQGAFPAGVTIKNMDSNGQHHTCVIGSDDKAYCWGYNSYGQLGNNSTTQAKVPVAVSQGAIPSGVTLKSVSGGSDNTCALGSDNKAYCWGRGEYGKLGNNSTSNSSVPVAVSQGAIPAGVTLQSVSAGNQSACGIGSNGKVYCWGANSYGQLGNSSTTNASTPVQVVQSLKWSTGSSPSSFTVSGFTFY